FDAKLPATSSDDCVSHSFPGEKKPRIIPQLTRFGKRKAGRIADASRGSCTPLNRNRRAGFKPAGCTGCKLMFRGTVYAAAASPSPVSSEYSASYPCAETSHEKLRTIARFISLVQRRWSRKI